MPLKALQKYTKKINYHILIEENIIFHPLDGLWTLLFCRCRLVVFYAAVFESAEGCLGILATARGRFLHYAIGSIHWMLPSPFASLLWFIRKIDR